MTCYFKNGSVFTPADEGALALHNTLPPGNYVIKLDPRENFYFEQIDSFTSSGKIYGKTLGQVERIMRTYEDRPVSTGVLLTGEKGSGKTMLAKLLSIEAAALGMPTIVVNFAWSGDKFNSLIQGIEQPCVILFDEFEKVYDHDEQKQVLTLLDGVFPSKKLFVLTCNDVYRVDGHMQNRPGRIFYLLNFKGLDAEFITEYCNDNLKNCEHINTICQIASLFAEFNFDMLKAMVEEMNRYNESPREVLEMLNAKPTTDGGGMYDVTLKVKGKAVKPNDIDPDVWRGSPLTQQDIVVTQYSTDDDEEDTQYNFTISDLKKVDAEAGTFTFINTNGVEVKFTRRRIKEFNYELF